MIVLESKLAKKYALAFLNVYAQKCTPDYMKRIAAYADFVTKNTMFQATLNIPSLSKKTKELIIEHVKQKVQMPKSIQKLTHLLLKEKRIDLLAGILKKILFIHKQREQKHHFTVSSSHELTAKEQEIVTNLIKKQVLNHVSTSFTLDTSLISGIRIEGNTLKWERSITKQLRSIEQKIVRQEELW